MAKASSKTRASNQKREKKSSGKQTRKKLGDRETEQTRLFDDETRRTIIGVVLALVALLLILIVAWPTNAPAANFLSLLLREGLGVGAYICPLILVLVAACFILPFENKYFSNRVILGLALVLFGLLFLLAVLTPDAFDANGVPTAVFDEHQIVVRGGYLGAVFAFVFMSLLGFPIALVISIGVIVVGLTIVALSFKNVIGLMQEKDDYVKEPNSKYDVLPADPYVPVQVSQRIKKGRRPSVSESANTVLLDGQNNPSHVPLFDGEGAPTVALEPGQHAPQKRKSASGTTGALTRKLGSGNNAKKSKKESDSRLPSAGDEAASQQAAAVQNSNFKLPSMSLLKLGKSAKKTKNFENELVNTAQSLQQTLEDFGIAVQVVDWVVGPTVTLFEVNLPPGVRVSRITALQDDIALALAAPGVRIFAPIPGTHYVGIEVPNTIRENVLLGDVLKEIHGGPLELAIGKDVEGNSVICDLAKMPHLLIGGSTGSGKSVGINAMIMSMLMRATPDQVRFIMIDPKRVEFSLYDGIPHLYVPVVTEPKEAASALAWGVAEMERRLKLFSKVGVRNIQTFNAKVLAGDIEGDAFATSDDKASALVPTESADGSQGSQGSQGDTKVSDTMPYIVIIIDELADLMMSVGKEVEYSISRIAQLARAAGIHLIVATQRPSANVVTGLIKSNITNRIAFNVASGLDSRVILDTVGAEALIGNGDLLLSKPELAKPLRIQGCFTSDEEIASVVKAVKSQGEPDYHSEILTNNLISIGDSSPQGSSVSAGDDDPLLWEAADIVVASGMGSTSNIQRKLKVGYSRAGRIMDMLEEKGVVGPPNGSKPRDVLVDSMELEALKAFEQSDKANE